jgi:hypothetical protein
MNRPVSSIKCLSQSQFPGSLFLPIPDSDPLTMLLAKYVPNPDLRPRRDLSGDYAHTDLQTLIVSGSRASVARLTIVDDQ